MSQRRKYDTEFRDGAVTIVRETGKPIAEAARELGVGAGTLGNWMHKDRLARGDGPDRTRIDAAYVRRLERENAGTPIPSPIVPLGESIPAWRSSSGAATLLAPADSRSYAMA
jgi:transposase